MKIVTAALAVLLLCSNFNAQDRLGPSPVDEVGVYYMGAGKNWVALPPEIINWQTGGVLKNIGTLGVVKGDVNGKVRYSSSKTHLTAVSDLLVYASEGTAIEEYQLIKLHRHSDSREFRTVTGGVFHVSGGAERDTMEFAGKHIAQRTDDPPRRP